MSDALIAQDVEENVARASGHRIPLSCWILHELGACKNASGEGADKLLHESSWRSACQPLIFRCKNLVRVAAGVIARKLRLQAIEEKHLVGPLVLRFDGTARLKIE